MTEMVGNRNRRCSLKIGVFYDLEISRENTCVRDLFKIKLPAAF